MDYNLAKELKEAGFKFDWERKCPSCTEEGTHVDCQPPLPTIEELIEACLEGDKKMQLNIDLKGCGAWIGNSYRKEKYMSGSTASEAVARLWLAINKK